MAENSTSLRPVDWLEITILVDNRNFRKRMSKAVSALAWSLRAAEVTGGLS
jgi:hypothetical protein